MDEVIVAGGAVVIRSERVLPEWEKQQIRNQFQTMEDVELGLALSERLSEVTAKVIAAFDATVEAALKPA